MEVVSENLDTSNLNFITDPPIPDTNDLKGNKSETVIYTLAPLLSESLNNLVKRLEKTKIPKPPPTKGHSIRKKSRVHASLPNLFLPSTFDDNKFCNSEKKVQWTNKLNLDLEKMKSLLRDNYNNWCKNKHRSQSIPNLTRNVDENDLPDHGTASVDFTCSRSKDENNMTIKFTKCDSKFTNENEEAEQITQMKSNSDTGLDSVQPPAVESIESTETDDKVSFSTHLYLDGAIIEPISPASPLQSVMENLSISEPRLEQSQKEGPVLEPIENIPENPPVLNSSVLPLKNKRGRKPGKKKPPKVTAKKPKSTTAGNNNESQNVKENDSECLEAPNLEPEISESTESIITTLVGNIESVNIANNSSKELPQEIKSSPDQANDLEILSKSITNSVDTSMLPPRKRYKRLMALENNKPGSPKDIPVIDTPQAAELPGNVQHADILNDIELKMDEKALAKAPISRSRSKRKKKTISSIKLPVDKKSFVPNEDEVAPVSLEPMECEELLKQPEEEDDIIVKIYDKSKIEFPTKPESLKRSKREAAARGFANMVAMSLNNSSSSQSQDNSIESKQNTSLKKSSSSRPDSNDTSSETSLGKLFKRPRKSKTVETTGPKIKIKRAKSPDSLDFVETKPKEIEPIELDKPKPGRKSKDAETNKVEKSAITRKSKEIENGPIENSKKSKEPETSDEVEKSKPKKPKEKVIHEENPSSPNETIISSNDSGGGGNQENIKHRKIRTNTYIDSKPLHWYEEVEKCGCKSSKLRNILDKVNKDDSKPNMKCKSGKKRLGIVWDCGDNCLNRLTYTECQAKNCQCGELCANQKIRKGEWAPGLKVKEISGKGKGVITSKPIREGTFIVEYVGEVINEHTFQDRMMNLYRDDSHHYCLHLDGEMLIDAYRSGSLARFVNHSCQPNCEMQKWMVNGAYRMCLFAIEDIPADAELYYDYNFCSFNTKNTQICLCGSACCRGFIGSKPRAEQTESQKDRKKLLYIFGRLLSGREKLFILRNSVFLLRNRELGRCQRLGIRKPQLSHGNRLPSSISEIKRRKAKKNQFLTQMSALNSIRSIKTRQLQNAQENENLTRIAQLGQVLKDLYNTLLEQKDPSHPNQQLVAPFINCLNRKKYPEFYRMIGSESVASLNQVYSRLLDGGYMTMMAFDQDILQMLQNVESYAGKQSNIGQCAERIKPIYRELKMNSIALYEALTDEVFEEKDKQKLISNNLQQITSALAAIKSHNQAASEIDTSESSVSNVAGIHKNKKRKQTATNAITGARGRLERGAEVIKCICGFLIEAGHVMVQCDRCFVWQHAYCMNVARSSELADVTRMEPYYCHICLNIPTENLIREIPRHFVISDETIGSDNTLFWTLLKSDHLFKIDDFVYISSSPDSKSPNIKPKSSKSSPLSSSIMMPIDLSSRTIMRIYSLWKDSNGQRWMEGGLFLRPYDNKLKSLTNIDSTKLTGTNKRKSSLSAVDLTVHKWHQFEVVYTDFTKILPLDACLGRCFVLNSYTFRQGRPLLQNSSLNNTNLDVFVCDWMVNQNGEWSELDPGYLKINTKQYCFDKFHDSNESGNSERFTRQYLAEDLVNIDEGSLPFIEANSNFNTANNGIQKLSNEEKISIKMKTLTKIIDKLVEFAFERNQNLPLSSTPSSISGSSPSSRGASPLCENSGSKSPLRNLSEPITHGSRKSVQPKKIIKPNEVIESSECPVVKSVELIKEMTTLPSEASDNSPQLMIVVDEFQQTPKNDPIHIEDPLKIVEKSSSTDEKDIEEKTVSSVKETIDDQSNLGSEINFGDFVNLLKNAEPIESVKEKTSKSKQKTSKLKTKSNKKMSKKTKKKIASKKSDLKPVSEISPGEDEWIPGNNSSIMMNTVEASSSRPRTRSRKTIVVEPPPPPNEDIDKCTESGSSNNNNTEVELILTGLNIKGIFTSSEDPMIHHESSANPIVLATHVTSDSSKIDEEDEDSTKHCFVKLERMKMKQNKNQHSSSSNRKSEETGKLTDIISISKEELLTIDVPSVDCFSDGKPIHSSLSTGFIEDCKPSKTHSKISKSSSQQPMISSGSSSVRSDSQLQQLTPNLLHFNKSGSDNDNDQEKFDLKNSGNFSSSSVNRSKRKKGVPKRIPFDFSYPQINALKPLEIVSTPVSSNPGFENEVVDLSSCRMSSDQQQQQQQQQPIDQSTTSAFNTQKLDTPDSSVVPNAADAAATATAAVNAVNIPNPKKSEPIGNSCQDTSLSASASASSSSSSSLLLFPNPPISAANVTETRHITAAANDFSSIENISSN